MKVMIPQLFLIVVLTFFGTVLANDDIPEQSLDDLLRVFAPDFVAVRNDSLEDISNLLRLLSENVISSSAKSHGDLNCTTDPRIRQLCTRSGMCSPLSNLTDMLGLDTKRSFEDVFKAVCPILFLQTHRCEVSQLTAPRTAREIVANSLTADSPHSEGIRKTDEGHPGKISTKTKPEPFKVWFYGMLSVTVISACSLTGLAIVPLLTRQLFNAMMNVFQGLAVGSLCGSAVFHLLPQAFDLEPDDHLWKSLVVFCGIYFFYLSERIVKIIADRKKEVKKKVNHAADITAIEEAGGLVDVHHGHSHGPPKDGTIASVAWLIIFGDGMHNFIDGLSLGAAFSNSILSGISISVAVVCEEFPHELGDFAVLLGAGMSPRQAVLYNFLSALTCFLGLAVGILVGDFSQGAPAIFAFAGGMFLYIALVGMMGEINVNLEKVVGCSAQVKTLLLQNLGIVSGVIAMFVMAKYADVIDFEGISVSSLDDEVISETLMNVQRGGKSILGGGI